MPGRDAERQRMVDVQLAARGIRDLGVLEAMRTVPRERFVDAGMQEFAYEDSPLPIAAGQTISQPYIVALMIEAAGIGPGDRVLEVGAGSGYAAAVISRIAGQVHAIERHATLVEAAQARFDALGYDNITLRHGDGSGGWPEQAPFDAILVAAGAPAPPQALRTQLAVGGRLVIPVGDSPLGQRLRRITRIDEGNYREDDLGGVSFVPLIGKQGWAEDGSRAASNHVPGRSRARGPAQLVADAAEPLPDIDDPGFAAAFDRFAGARVVLLGECSHGTSQFYRARAAITRRLVAHHRFDTLAIEADWPDVAVLNRHIRGQAPRPDAEPIFQRFPRWMWQNAEFAAMIGWLRDHNQGCGAAGQAGIYGLDLYNMHASIGTVLAYLDQIDPDAAATARVRYGCLTPWQKDPATYGRAVLDDRYRTCEQEVVRQCSELLARQIDYARAGADGERFLDAAQSARLVAAAERYYRIMYYGGADSWNLRDTHMFDTLCHLLDAQGARSRAVVWAHNSHVGDARHTDMGTARGELNIGQLCRERFGDDACLLGFGTHAGTVAAAHDWDAPMEVMEVRPSHRNSLERLCHDNAPPRALLDLRESTDPVLHRALRAGHLERFIGVIYRPRTELQSHYAEVSPSRQFDAYVWFDQTHAVAPLGGQAEGWDRDVPDTFPFAT